MSVSIADQLGQLFIIGVQGHSLTNDEKRFIIENDIGGVILFGRNVSTPEQVRDLCDEIQSLRLQQKSKNPLSISIDMEGGRVHRLKQPFTQWPALAHLGLIDNPTVSFQFAKCMGLELFACGINLDYAPCLDIFTNPKNTVIGDRAVGTTAAIVEKHASALVRGYIKSNIIPCVKHFPGHGNTVIDSHEDLPIEENDLKSLEERELIPFRKAFRSKADLVMMGHLLFKNIDPEWPATLSEKFIGTILKENCRFRGVVMTDDLDMKAMAKHHTTDFIPVRALQAGVDMLLYCNEPASPPAALEGVRKALADKKLDVQKLETSHQKILGLKSKISLELPNRSEMLEIVNNPLHKELAQKIRDKTITPEFLSQFKEDKEV